MIWIRLDGNLIDWMNFSKLFISKYLHVNYWLELFNGVRCISKLVLVCKNSREGWLLRCLSDFFDKDSSVSLMLTDFMTLSGSAS